MDTELIMDALHRDLGRWHRATDDRERLMIMGRMIDTMCDLDPELDLEDARIKVTEMIKTANVN